MNARLCLFVAISSLALGACAHANGLDGRIQGLGEILDQAEQSGARTCAPRELAMARANLRFAADELAQGHLRRAEEHYRIAEPNAQAARTLSPADRCLPDGAPAPVAPPVERPAVPIDTDGDGLVDPDDRCPTEPEDFDHLEDTDGCPEDQDTDGDGHTDSRDVCPADPEDVDGFEDTDGCPEPDNDADGVLDAADRCANDAEDPDGFEDADGCPDRDNDTDATADVDDHCPNEAGPADNQGCPRVYRNVEVTDTHIRITQTIHFEHNRATIRSVSFPILDVVAQVLRDFPNIRIEVQGHTDDSGNDDYNMRLSDQRAHAVRDYLISKGIAEARLSAVGLGETRPIAPNNNGRNRALNRRVEFVRTETPVTGATP